MGQRVCQDGRGARIRKLLHNAFDRLYGWLNLFLDCIAPMSCMSCGALFIEDVPKGLPICPECSQSCIRVAHPICPICGIPILGSTSYDILCQRCIHEKPPFSKLRSFFIYEGSVKDIILRYKYAKVFEIGKALGKALACLAYEEEMTDVDFVTAVPLTPKRLCSRGYNQSVILARSVSKMLKIPFVSCLSREREGIYEKHLSRKIRLERVKGAFRIVKDVKDKRILLVDDVVTTNATVSECARILKKGGAVSVNVLSVARATHV